MHSTVTSQRGPEKSDDEQPDRRKGPISRNDDGLSTTLFGVVTSDLRRA